MSVYDMEVVDKSLTSDSMLIDSTEESLLSYVPSELETLREEKMKNEKKSASLIKALQVLSEKLDEEENARAKLQTENLRLISNLKELREENAELKEKKKEETLDEEENKFEDMRQHLEAKIEEMTIDIDQVITSTVAKLNDAEGQLNKKNHEIFDLQQQLDMKEKELNKILPKFEKEKCERNLQLETLSSDASLKKLKEHIVILENKNQEEKKKEETLDEEEKKYEDLRQHLEAKIEEMTIDNDLVITCTVAKLNDAEDQLNEKNHQIIDLQQQLNMKENELNEILPKLEKEKCERKKLQLEKLSSDTRLKKLEEDIVILETKNQEVVREKKILKESLDEVSQSLSEEKKISKQLSDLNEKQIDNIFELEELLLIECQLNEEMESIQYITETTMMEQLEACKRKLRRLHSILEEERSSRKKLQSENVKLDSELKKLQRDLPSHEMKHQKSPELETSKPELATMRKHLKAYLNETYFKS